MKFNGTLKFLIVLAVLLAVANIASADLNLTEVKVRIQSSSTSDTTTMSTNHDSFSNVKPESKLSFDITAANNLAALDIKDVEIKVTLEGVDDGSDLQDSTDTFTLRPGTEKTKKLYFDIPQKIDEGDYNIAVEVTGRDTNNTRYDQIWDETMTVQKESHKLVITNTLDKDTYKCGDKGTLNVDVINLGQNDEDKVVLGITSSDLNIQKNIPELSLTSDLFSSDSEYSTVIPFTIPKTANDATYTINVKAYYNTNKLSDQQVVNVPVVCVPVTVTTTSMPPVTTTLPASTGNQNGNQQNGVGGIEGQQPYYPVPIQTVSGSSQATDSGILSKLTGSTTMLVVLIVLVVVTLGVLLAVIFTRKE